MSVEILDSIKQQANELSAQEKAQLAQFLLEQNEQTELPTNNSSLAARTAKFPLVDKWMRENADKYGGQYVALDGDRLLGTGKNYPEAAQAAQRAGVKDAFIDFVRPADYVAEWGGW